MAVQKRPCKYCDKKVIVEEFRLLLDFRLDENFKEETYTRNNKTIQTLSLVIRKIKLKIFAKSLNKELLFF